MAERVGFVGLGAMGRGMALALLAAGHDVVVHNRTRAKEAELVAAGATAAASPAEVAAGCEVVCSCLVDEHAVAAVYLGPEGLATAARAGQLLVELGTFAPAVARTVAAAAAARGADFLDAPVTGGPAAAQARRLVVMVGGEERAAERARPLLGAFAAQVARVGPVGCGLELKLVNQLLVVCHVAAYAEAFALLRALELPLDVAAELLNAGWGASAMLARGLERAQRGDFAGDGATLAGLRGVERLVAAFAAEQRVPPLTLLPAAGELLDRALSAGLGDQDIAGLVNVFDDRAGPPA